MAPGIRSNPRAIVGLCCPPAIITLDMIAAPADVPPMTPLRPRSSFSRASTTVWPYQAASDDCVPPPSQTPVAVSRTCEKAASSPCSRECPLRTSTDSMSYFDQAFSILVANRFDQQSPRGLQRLVAWRPPPVRQIAAGCHPAVDSPPTINSVPPTRLIVGAVESPNRATRR